MVSAAAQYYYIKFGIIACGRQRVPTCQSDCFPLAYSGHLPRVLSGADVSVRPWVRLWGMVHSLFSQHSLTFFHHRSLDSLTITTGAQHSTTVHDELEPPRVAWSRRESQTTRVVVFSRVPRATCANPIHNTTWFVSSKYLNKGEHEDWDNSAVNKRNSRESRWDEKAVH